MNIKFEKISHQQLKGLFDSFKDNSIKQSFSINNIKEENLPLNVSQSLTEQTKNLNIRINSEKKSANLSKFISKKVNKKEKDLKNNQNDEDEEEIVERNRKRIKKEERRPDLQKSEKIVCLQSSKEDNSEQKKKKRKMKIRKRKE